MGQEVDWSKFPKPWNRLGPELAARVAEDTRRILDDLPPGPVNRVPQTGGPAPGRKTYPRHF